VVIVNIIAISILFVSNRLELLTHTITLTDTLSQLVIFNWWMFQFWTWTDNCLLFYVVSFFFIGTSLR